MDLRKKSAPFARSEPRKPGPKPGVAKNQKGQVSILLGTMMLTFILFFAFVVNIGMLVNAKINLQNAADLAAYAGAATQARQLNQISYLNYEMRRQFKKFLFRYYVMGNMAQRTHPTGGGNGVRKWSPDGNVVDHTVPAVCMTFNPGDNFCQVTELTKLAIPPANILDSVNTVLIDQLKALESIRKQGCKSIGKTNIQLLNYWLYNTDPTLQAIEQLFNDAATASPTDASILRTLKSLASGLGLVPRELILSKRINTLAEYVNARPETRVTLDRVNDLRQGVDWAKNERTIQAYYSAFHTLGENTFERKDTIEMTELLPEASEGANLLALKPVSASFDTYAIDMNVGQEPGAPDETPANCSPTLVANPLKFQVPMGVYKIPSVLTYYAVKLQAEAKVMFSPFGDVKLTAYAAAQPFGSRIGPRLESGDFIYSANPLGATCLSCVGAVPNLAVKESGDGSNASQGWNKNDVIYATFRGFETRNPGGAGGTVPVKISLNDMLQAYDLAMFPNPYERGKYNILNDLNGTDPFVQNFESADGLHAIWAPIVSPEKRAAGADVKDELRSMINQMTTAQGGTAGPSTGAANALSPAFREALLQGLERYYVKLSEGKGEDGEGVNVARLSNPFKETELARNPEVFMKEPGKIKSSWNSPYDGALREAGRTGYSVKYVSFKLLRSGSAGVGESWTNTPSGDEESVQDIEKLKH